MTDLLRDLGRGIVKLTEMEHDGNVSTARLHLGGESPASSTTDTTQDDLDVAAYETGQESQSRRLRRQQDDAAEAAQDWRSSQMTENVNGSFTPEPDSFDRVIVEVNGTRSDHYSADEDDVIEINLPYTHSWMPGELRQSIIRELHQAGNFTYLVSENIGITNWGASGSQLRIAVQLTSVAATLTNNSVVKALEGVLRAKATEASASGWVDETDLVTKAKYRVALRWNVSTDSLLLTSSEIENNLTGTVSLRGNDGVVYEFTFRGTNAGLEAVRMKRSNLPRG